MATISITFRMDEELKKKAETLFDEIGINMTTALNAFVKETVREGKIPFELVGDSYAHQRMVIQKLREAEQYAAQPNAKWYDEDELFASINQELSRKGKDITP